MNAETVNVIQLVCPGCDLRRPPATMRDGLCDVCRGKGKKIIPPRATRKPKRTASVAFALLSAFIGPEELSDIIEAGDLHPAADAAEEARTRNAKRDPDSHLGTTKE